jgi:hypothetical protein
MSLIQISLILLVIMGQGGLPSIFLLSFVYKTLSHGDGIAY